MMDRAQLQAVWRWRLTRVLESIGRPGWLGLAALAVALVLGSTVLRNMAKSVGALQQEISEVRQGKTGQPQGSGAAMLPRLLPGPSAAADFATGINALAGQNGVRVDRMEYQLQREAGKPILVYRADLVAVAPYLQVRSWLDALLREKPTVAIEELVFERPTADLGEVTARVRLAFFMKGEP